MRINIRISDGDDLNTHDKKKKFNIYREQYIIHIKPSSGVIIGMMVSSDKKI